MAALLKLFQPPLLPSRRQASSVTALLPWGSSVDEKTRGDCSKEARDPLAPAICHTEGRRSMLQNTPDKGVRRTLLHPTRLLQDTAHATSAATRLRRGSPLDSTNRPPHCSKHKLRHDSPPMLRKDRRNGVYSGDFWLLTFYLSS